MTSATPIGTSFAALGLTYLDLLRDKEALLQGIEQSEHKRVKTVMYLALSHLDLRLLEVSLSLA